MPGSLDYRNNPRLHPSRAGELLTPLSKRGRKREPSVGSFRFGQLPTSYGRTKIQLLALIQAQSFLLHLLV